MISYYSRDVSANFQTFNSTDSNAYCLGATNSTLFDRISRVIGASLQGATNGVTDGLSSLRQAVVSGATGVKDSIGASIQGATTLATDVLNSLGQVVVSGATGVKDSVVDGVRALPSLAARGVAGTVNGIAQAVNTVVPPVTGVVGDTLAATGTRGSLVNTTISGTLAAGSIYLGAHHLTKAAKVFASTISFPMREAPQVTYGVPYIDANGALRTSKSVTVTENTEGYHFNPLFGFAERDIAIKPMNLAYAAGNTLLGAAEMTFGAVQVGATVTHWTTPAAETVQSNLFITSSQRMGSATRSMTGAMGSFLQTAAAHPTVLMSVGGLATMGYGFNKMYSSLYPAPATQANGAGTQSSISGQGFLVGAAATTLGFLTTWTALMTPAQASETPAAIT